MIPQMEMHQGINFAIRGSKVLKGIWNLFNGFKTTLGAFRIFRFARAWIVEIIFLDLETLVVITSLVEKSCNFK